MYKPASPVHLTLRLALPCCGAVVEHTATNKTPGDLLSATHGLADMLTYWFESRIERHQCGLVSETNPVGTA